MTDDDIDKLCPSKNIQTEPTIVPKGDFTAYASNGNVIFSRLSGGELKNKEELGFTSNQMLHISRFELSSPADAVIFYTLEDFAGTRICFKDDASLSEYRHRGNRGTQSQWSATRINSVQVVTDSYIDDTANECGGEVAKTIEHP